MSSSHPTRFTYAEAPREFEALHRLATAILPPHRLRAVLECAGSPVAALHLEPSVLCGKPLGLTERQAARIVEARTNPLPAAFEKSVQDVFAVLYGDASYPFGMVPLSDAPALLFVRGELKPEDTNGIAIVGSRRATPYGKNQATKFARAFAERGLVVVSGGAAGVDTSAHQGAMGANGRTVAVLGCGVDVVYPSENRGLFEEIVNRGGAIISEYGIGVTPEPWHFPARNRIIAGIAQVTLVVETPNNSGALITARHCGEYGRDLFVVPGSVEGGRSRGGHDLVKDGAFLVDEPDEVLAHLGLSGEHSGQGQMVFTPAAPTPKSVMPAATVTAPPAPFTPAPVAPISPAPVNLSPDENAFYAQLTTSPAPFDQIAIAADLPTPRASVAATLLEIKGLISRKPGNLFSLAR